MRYIPELLAPVGGEEQLRAAVENGADAVYMGGRAFHARVNAGSFGGRQLEDAVEYAHSKGAKVYITLNTLVTDGEMEEAIAEARECYVAGVDALIVQDYGLARELRRRVPGMELHLSTQGTVYDLDGVLEARDLGFARVVLARETPFSQIRQIAENCDVPLEVFVHGALCMCYSGQCQMSRFQGGRSGNRGGCAQPCRLPYELLHNGATVQERGGANAAALYRLSPRDMCTIDHLGALAEAGVASLKIEGRMKSPEYVAVVTKIYRKYLDLYQRDGEYEVAEEDRKALLQIFNRGNFTDGYLWENPRKQILSGRLPKHQGIRLGKVLKVRTAGEGKAIRQFLTVKLSEDLHLGDGVEVQGTAPDGQLKLSGNIVTYIGESSPIDDRRSCGNSNGSRCRTNANGSRSRGNSNDRRSGGAGEKNRKSLRSADAGEIVEIGDVPGDIHPGDWIYRISEKTQLEEARKTFDITSGQAKKESRKLPVDMALKIREGRPVELTARTGTLSATVIADQIPEPAVTRPLDEAGARRQLEKTGDTMFALSGLTLIADENLMVRASVLNQLRREALERLTELWEDEQKNGARKRREQALAVDARRMTATDAEARTPIIALPGRGRRSLYLFRADDESLALAQTADFDRFYFSYQVFLDGERRRKLQDLVRNGKQVFAWLPSITQGREHQLIEENREAIVDSIREVPGAGLAVNNLGQIRAFRNCGVLLYGDYGLNLYNSADFAWAKAQGLAGAVVCHEAFDNGFPNPMKELPHLCGLEGEVVIGGRIPLMISAHCPIGDATGCRGPRTADGPARGATIAEKRGAAMAEACGAVGSGACDGGCYALRDRKGRSYPLLTEKLDCRTTIFSEAFGCDVNAAAKEYGRMGYGVRVYALDPADLLRRL